MNQSVQERRQHVDKAKSPSIVRQCGLLSINRSGVYYTPRQESWQNLELMRMIDEEYLKYPFYGVPRMTHHLRRMGHEVNKKRIGRLYKLMGLEAIGPNPNTSKPAPGHKIYPYLLRGMRITRSNQAWATDITYIPMSKGYMYVFRLTDGISAGIFTVLIQEYL